MQLPVVESWFKDGLSFECTQCGNCCTGGPGYVWMSGEEIEKLAGHLGLPKAEVLKKYCRKLQGKVSLKESLTPEGLYDCVFLKTLTDEKTGKSRRVCGIYEVRPLQCRTWPFWDGLLSSPTAWKQAGKMCPGIDKGKHYTEEKIVALRDTKEWPGKGEAPTSGRPRKA